MGIDPMKIPYLAAASGTIGSVRAENILQRGEIIGSLSMNFKLINFIPAHQGLR